MHILTSQFYDTFLTKYILAKTTCTFLLLKCLSQLSESAVMSLIFFLSKNWIKVHATSAANKAEHVNADWLTAIAGCVSCRWNSREAGREVD